MALIANLVDVRSPEKRESISVNSAQPRAQSRRSGTND